MPRALVIRHHAEDGAGLVGEALIDRGYELTVVLLDESNGTPSVEGHDVVVILGSTHAVYDPYVEAAWFGRELGVIEEADRRGLAIFGICFGAQALCKHFGGEVQRGARPEIGWYVVETTPGSPIEPGPWFEYHFDACTLPPTAETWATTPNYIQAFAIGRHVGVQFHPELDSAQLAEWFGTGTDDLRVLGLSPSELIAETSREEPYARARAARLIDTFLAHASSRNGVGPSTTDAR